MSHQEITFQFPSNGKAYPKFCTEFTFYNIKNVSIPFKRESVSKECFVNSFDMCFWFCFNSLQTGKRIQSNLCSILSGVRKVSIPFKRESVSKEKCRTLVVALLVVLLFQFPSNGESVSKVKLSPGFTAESKFVSIPFKRESVSKGDQTMHTLRERAFCFNSLQTGKAYPKQKHTVNYIHKRICFNSLQTGKRIQRRF